MIAGTLEIMLLANMARLQSDMDSAKRVVDEATTSMKRAADAAKGALIGLAGAFSAGALIESMKSAVDSLAELNDAALKTGSSIAEMSRMQQVAAAYGGDFAMVQAGVSRMVAKMGDDTSTAAHALAALGISAKDSAGNLRDGGTVLAEVAGKLAEYQDGTNKVALAIDLMGRNGAQLLPFLKDYAENVDKVTAADAAAAEQAKAFQDKIGELKNASAQFRQHLATEMIPQLFDYIALLATMKGQSDGASQGTSALTTAMNWLGTALESIIVLARNVAYVFEQVGKEIGAFVAQGEALSRAAADLMRGDLAAAKADFAQAIAIHKDAQAQAEAARKALDQADQRTLAARQLSQAQQSVANPSNPMLDKRYNSQAVLDYTSASADKAAKSVEDLGKKFDDLLAKIQGKSAGLDADFFKNMDLLATQGAKAGLSLKQIVDLQGQYIKQQPFAIQLEKDKQKAIEDAAKANTKAVDEMLAEQNKAIETDYAQIKSAREYLDSINFQTQALTMNKTALAEATAMRELERQGVVKGTAAYDAYAEKIKQAVIEKATVQASVDRAKEIEDYWRKATDDINASLTDALMRGFESGKGYAANLRDAVKSMFSTLVLRPVIQAVMSPVSTGIAGMLGGPTAASASSLTSGVSLLSNGSSLANLFTEGGGLLGGIAGSTAAYGAAIGGGSLAAGSQAAMLASQTGVFGTAGLSATAAAAGGTAGAAMATLAAAAPYLAAAVALYSAFSSMDGGETRQGGQYGIGDILRNNHGVGTAQSLSGLTLLSNPSGGEIAGGAVQTSITQTVEGINKLLAATGSQAVVKGFQAGLESSGEGRGGVYAGGTLSTGATFGLSGLGDNYNGTLYDKAFSTSPDSKTALENFSTELLQTTVQALQAATDIPKFIGDQLEDVDAKKLTSDAATALITGIQQQVDSINAFNAAMQTLPFAGLTSLSLDAAAALGQAVGGISNLANMASRLQSFANNTAFYSQPEIDARDKANLQATLSAYGMSLPTTTAGYRALVEQATAEAGAGNANSAQALQGLLDNADTFARIVSDATTAIAQPPAWTPGTGSGGGSNSALSDWQRATDAIVSTMRDLRQTLLGNGAESLAQLQTQFAITTAQAKAGDITAAQNLPQLAKDLVNAGQKWSATAQDQALLTSNVLASLASVLGARGVTIPQFASGGVASGLALVGENGPELVQLGSPSQVYSNARTSALLGGGEAASELAALRAELAALRAENGAENRAIATNTAYIKQALVRVMPEGDAITVRTVV